MLLRNPCMWLWRSGPSYVELQPFISGFYISHDPGVYSRVIVRSCSLTDFLIHLSLVNMDLKSEFLSNLTCSVSYLKTVWHEVLNLSCWEPAITFQMWPCTVIFFKFLAIQLTDFRLLALYFRASRVRLSTEVWLLLNISRLKLHRMEGNAVQELHCWECLADFPCVQMTCPRVLSAQGQSLKIPHVVGQQTSALYFHEDKKMFYLISFSLALEKQVEKRPKQSGTL